MTIAVRELPARDQALDCSVETVLGVVGRTRRGPVNVPVTVTGLSEFERRFGAGWHLSLLPDALEQFFSHGGRRAVVVRVVNGATHARFELPSDTDPLSVVAHDPGADESLRLAVDYDGVRDTHSFNLTVQRLSAYDGRITDQEIFRDVTVVAGESRFVADALLASTLIRLDGDVPSSRPLATDGLGIGTRHGGYRLPLRAGSDGSCLSDYDLIGSRTERTGMLALSDESIDILYLPPATAGASHGPALTVAAERFCRDRGALLLADPPVGAEPSAPPIRSPHVCTYYPRLLDRAAPRDGPVPVAAALAGLMAKSETGERPGWTLGTPGTELRRRYRLPPLLGDGTVRLPSGVNGLEAAASGRLRLTSSMTTSGGIPDGFGDLAQLRLFLLIRRSLVEGTRWALCAPPGSATQAEIERQLADFLARCARRGWFGDDGRGRWFARCELEPPASVEAASPRLTLTAGFLGPGRMSPVALTIRQTLTQVDCHAAAVTRAGFDELLELRPGSGSAPQSLK